MVGTESISAGERGPALELSGPTLDGGRVDLVDLRGRVVVLNSWASWCEPCRDEVPAFVSLASSSADVAVVGLNVTDDAPAARAFAAEFGIPYPSIADPDGALLRTIPGVPPSSLPSTVILDRQGRVAARIIGAATYDGVSSLVAEIGSESAPTATTGQEP